MLRYDGSARMRAAVTRAGEVATATLRAPLEPGVARVSVELVAGAATEELGSLAVADLPGPASDAPPSPVAASSPRWLKPLLTAAGALLSGDALQPQWWADRRRRYAALARSAPQRVRERSLERRRVRALAGPSGLAPAELAALAARQKSFAYWPLFSVLMPVYNVEPRWLELAVASLDAQVYPEWELCLADDASTDPGTRAAVERLRSHPKVRVEVRPENGHIVAASNSALALARGEWVALLDHDDALAPRALYRYAEALQAASDIDLFYSDESKLDLRGREYDPHYKPEYSPELLLAGYNYVNHFVCARRSLVEQVGGFREGTDGAQDLDLLLRLTEVAKRVERVPEVLYHWRALDESTAASAGVKPYVHVAARRGPADAFRRRGIDADLATPEFARRLNLPAVELAAVAAGPSLAVIVAGPDAPDWGALSDYPVAEVRAAEVAPGGSVAAAFNAALAEITSELVLFADAGVSPQARDSLGRLVAAMALPGVAVAGGRMLSPDGSIVSAGTVALDPPQHAFAGQNPDPASYFYLAESTRTVSGPGRGLLLTRAADLRGLGGFDAADFPRTLFDLDYCARLAAKGLRSVHVGGATFTQVRSSPARGDAPSERAAYKRRHGAKPDPYYSPNLDPAGQFRPEPQSAGELPPGARLPVLFGTHHLGAFEGASNILREIAFGLVADARVVGTVWSPAPGPAEADYRGRGFAAECRRVEWAPLLLNAQWTPAEYRRAVRDCMAAIRRAKPRVVVANTVLLAPLVEAAAHRDIPCVWLIHESYGPHERARLMSPHAEYRVGRAFQLARSVVFSSTACRDCYAAFDQGRGRIIPSTVDHERIAKSLASSTQAAARPAIGADSRVRFLAVGSVCERKAQHHLVEAAALLAKSRRDFVVSLVGGRAGVPYLDYVEHLIAARGVGDCVEVVPETPHVDRHFRAADVYASASYVEAYSVATLEALAFGLPVLATRAGGFDEQVSWGENGLPVAFGDPADMAAKMAQLLDDPALRARFGRESRAAYEQLPSTAELVARHGRVLVGAAR